MSKHAKDRKPTIREAVRLKWPLPEQKEWWYGKLTLVRRAKTARLSEAQNHRCCYCGDLTWMDENDRFGLPSSKMATLDHLNPVSYLGTDHPLNLVMACYSCNSRRGNMAADAFFEIMKDPKKRAKLLRTKTIVLEEARARRRQRRDEKYPHRKPMAVLKMAWLLYHFPELMPVVDELIRRADEYVARGKKAA